MSYASFVPLRVLSSYSMLEGAIDPKAIAKLAKERGFPAIAICDRNGLYGTPAFAAACKAEGVQPIIGTLLGVARGDDGPIDYLPLYAQEEAGWQNLCHLVSRAHLDRPLEIEPHVRLADLEGRTDGLIALTGAGEGSVVRLLAEGRAALAHELLEKLASLFPGRLYVEVARRGDSADDDVDDALVDLAYALDLPLLATNPPNFGEPHSQPAPAAPASALDEPLVATTPANSAGPPMPAAADASSCTAPSTPIDSAARPRSSPEAFDKSAAMMEEPFAALPEATATTLVVAKR